jgi:hypothetical protein
MRAAAMLRQRRGLEISGQKPIPTKVKPDSISLVLHVTIHSSFGYFLTDLML